MTVKGAACRVFRHTLVGVILLSVIGPELAYGHGLALPFAFWGNFPPGAARCQRVIAEAAARCGTSVWSVRTTCLGSLLDGGSCDVTSVPDLVQRAHLSALDAVDRQCTSPETQALGFVLKFEAQTDLDNFCHAVDDAMVSAVYGPVKEGDAVRSADPTTVVCVDTATWVATMMLRFSFRSRRVALDRIARHNLPPSEKQAMIQRSSDRIERMRSLLAGLVDEICPRSDFDSIYNHSAGELLETIAQRADCLSSAIYVQNGVVCPPSVCGNGMKEAGEQCDDGNTISGDGCSSDCKTEAQSMP